LHNGLGYDVPLIKKVENIVLPTDKIIDTMILSKMFFPDIGGHAKPHSIEAWGQRFGIPKPEHEDWSQFSPEMLHRNKEDVRITTMLFHHLVHHGFDINGL
ncbi:MAG: hypothetical protein H3Z50_08040, partial [archaeon]|nr:hypothetical protein [archaeon]